MEKLILLLNSQGWLVHNLYQGTKLWEARLKLQSSELVYAYGTGETASEALQAALDDGEIRRNWRPFKPAAKPKQTTTDDLMGGLDL